MTANVSGGRVPWRLVRWAVIAGLILAPLAAMQFTDEVAWTTFDFAVFAGLLVGAGVGAALPAQSRAEQAGFSLEQPGSFTLFASDMAAEEDL